MRQRHFTTSLAITLVLGLGGAARAQDGNLEASALNITPVVMLRALAPGAGPVAGCRKRSAQVERHGAAPATGIAVGSVQGSRSA